MADIMASDIRKYVTDKIDEAIKNEWIKVYYQPVIRTITQELCGVDSLARWIDPEVGFLSPDKIIDALEASEQIHKLDSYIVEKVCKDIHDLMSKNMPLLYELVD